MYVGYTYIKQYELNLIHYTHHNSEMMESIGQKYLVWALGWGFGDGPKPCEHSFQNDRFLLIIIFKIFKKVFIL